MENKSWMSGLLVALLSAITTILVAFNTNNIDQLRIQSGNAQGLAEQLQVKEREERQLDETKRATRQKFLTEYVPNLISHNDGDRTTATALLFILYPNEAKDILASLKKAVGDQPALGLEQTLVRANALAVQTGSWAIVIGSDATFPDAQFEVARARDNGYPDGVIYRRDGIFATTVGTFPDQSTAERSAIAVRLKIRNSAFVVNILSWCPVPQPRDGFSECSAT